MLPSTVHEDIQNILKRELKDYIYPKPIKGANNMKNVETSTKEEKKELKPNKTESWDFDAMVNEIKTDVEKNQENDQIVEVKLDNSNQNSEVVQNLESNNENIKEIQKISEIKVEEVENEVKSDELSKEDEKNQEENVDNDTKKTEKEGFDFNTLTKDEKENWFEESGVPLETNAKAQEIAGLIHDLILGYNVERYKYIIQVNLFQNQDTGTIMDCGMFWDTEKDQLVQEVFKTDQITCAVVVFSVYYN